VQIAAEAGHLQLCDFLLQEFTVCRFDAQIHEALMGFLGEYWFIHARSGSRLSLENYDGLTERRPQRPFDRVQDDFEHLWRHG
jgi:hypothetical protein